VKITHDADTLYQIAQLRHAYAHLKAGRVKDQAEFADGLIAPVIEFLEQQVTGASAK
jgi:hypothetical protein